MSSDTPLVCAVMLMNGRLEMVKRAIRSYRSQTYERKNLLILDSGRDPLVDVLDLERGEFYALAHPPLMGGVPIGALRNFANAMIPSADVIVHWDSDDWSAPLRIEHQLVSLRASPFGCVGYNSMLFWREPPTQPWETVHCLCGKSYPCSGAPCSGCGRYPMGEAWMYRNGNPRYALGSSLCYVRRHWETSNFWNDLPCSPDSASEYAHWMGHLTGVQGWIGNVPALIATIHGGNTSSAYRRELMVANEAQGGEWRRSPDDDAVCVEALKL